MTSPEANVKVKICGIKDRQNFATAVESGADYMGLVFVPASPRHITPDDAATLLSEFAGELRPVGKKIVAVMVDPTDKELAEVLSKVHPDILQLHGSETRERVREIAGVYDIRIMKALPISTREDVENAKNYVGYADMLLFDARAPKGEISGGHGVAFDWALMDHLDIGIPWFLSGGLTPENLREAVTITGAKQVDVSSGVEKTRGEKDPDLIKQFMLAAKPNQLKDSE